MKVLALTICAAASVAASWAAADCPAPPDPVVSLSFDSRYADDSDSRSDIDPDALAEVEDAIGPVDDFLRDLTSAANDVFDPDKDAGAIADCVLARIAVWAQADALSDLSSETAQLTIGSRMAGFGLVLMQVLPFAGDQGQADMARDWMVRLMRAQTRFWEDDAPSGARQGNLRAWAALGAASTAAITGDTPLRSWAAWSVSHVLCSAATDGSLPQEMRRGSLALRYQLHAIAPLVVTTLLLERQGVALQSACDDALERVVAFAVDDLEDGAASRAITGEVQSFFDGSDALKDFNLAWIEAYLQIEGVGDRDRLDRLAEGMRPLRYSKLGGDQTLIWDEMR